MMVGDRVFDLHSHEVMVVEAIEGIESEEVWLISTDDGAQHLRKPEDLISLADLG